VNIGLLRFEKEQLMFIIDAATVLAFAGLITAVSALIWSIRRKP
jgi:hypothetical protein